MINAINRVLSKTPLEQVVQRISQLAEPPCNWELIRCLCGYFFPLYYSLNTPVSATAAGFWFLHKKNIYQSEKAFYNVSSLNYGSEMFNLTQTLFVFDKAKNINNIAALKLPNFPKQPLLRSDTWKAIASLRGIAEDIKVIKNSSSRSSRAFALSRAIGELKNLRNQRDTLPELERDLINTIVIKWSVALMDVATEVGQIRIDNRVTNSYIVGDPVRGKLFIGREDVIRQLKELWVMGNQLQSVVLYGHRRMGKTSILLNASQSLGSGIQLAYVNLLRLGDSPQGVGEVLIAISDEISQTVKLPPPNDADLLNLSYRTFERYLKQVEAQLETGLIIALDEFEKIEELIEAGKIPPDFMGYLRGLVQMSSKVAFAFAGLHTLEEMTADYFQPFFASVIPIHIKFLERAATRQILANPGEDFLLDYTPEVLEEIYALTHGQPYLVQLLGFQLVRRYNDQVFEQGRSRDPVFTVDDVEAVINNPEFFQRGRYYFDGVWGQAAQDVEGQQEILKVLAPYVEGLSFDALAESTGMSGEGLQRALDTLKRHDVVEEVGGGWRIMVELFRRWVVQWKV
ncbi:AAA family ATPase [Nostoc sp. CMAA1605]|uniref:AAA family ATPase n=1 Tax=Nostoc sp. CMAA1605 TaxID=2055159 RepID=UPI001F3FADB3|nr:ATP-binding protein [Nostoc sp. CMAA1605]